MRVRFAPSPTGSLHLGGLRTAVTNFLFVEHAKLRQKQQAHKDLAPQQNDIQSARSEAPHAMILRIEDTDQKRLVEGSIQELIKMLHWAGIHFDEGPSINESKQCSHDATETTALHSSSERGQFGPYTQSHRLPIYRTHIEDLILKGHAYPCFCHSDRLQSVRDQQRALGHAMNRYDQLCRPPQGTDPKETLQRMRDAQPGTFVVRMRVPRTSQSVCTTHDLVCGTQHTKYAFLDDIILLKSDAYPTYHFACVVDDHLMRVSHVIRGVEWLTASPIHHLLYRMFGWRVPQFAHLPLLTQANGLKLSKRHGAQASVEYYIQQGYEPAALVNYIACLGWSPHEREATPDRIYTVSELIARFDMSRMSAKNAIVDEVLLSSVNKLHLARLIDQKDQTFHEWIYKQIHQQHIASRQSEIDRAVAQHQCMPLTPTTVEHLLIAMKQRSGLRKDFVRYAAAYIAPLQFESPEVVQFRDAVLVASSAQRCVEMLQACHEHLSRLPASAWSDQHVVSSDASPHGSAPGLAAVAPTIYSCLVSVVASLSSTGIIKQKPLFSLLRYVTQATATGPSISVILQTLGREVTLRRLEEGEQHFRRIQAQTHASPNSISNSSAKASTA